jgi:hypothetical protein
MQVHGACHCGAITYRAEIDPNRVIICHCSDCQAMSGSAYRVVAFTVENGFELITGEPKTYVKVAASGRQRAQGFCANCGSALYAVAHGDGPRVYGLRVGTIKERASLQPKLQVWCDSALAWTQDIHALPQVAQQP